jgi:DNA-binding response OmpR family regulator
MPEETILIIDDSIELCSLLESILPLSGYRTLSASTGEEGLNLASEFKPDLILLDLELPDTTGLKVLEELGQRKPAIPTIMITGYGSEGVAARALGLGAEGYLIKPFTTEEVLSSVEKALTVRHLRREKAQLATLLDAYTHHLRTISAVGRAVISGLDSEQFFQRIVEAGSFVTRAERCLLVLQDATPDGHPASAQVVAVHGNPRTHAEEPSGAGGAFPSAAGDRRLWAVLSRGDSVRLHASLDTAITLQTGEAARAVLQVPLKSRERIAGLLSVDRQHAQVPFGRHDELMLSILADYVVLALDSYRQSPMAAPFVSGEKP